MSFRYHLMLCFSHRSPTRMKIWQRWTYSLSLLQEQKQEMQFRQPTLEMAALARFPEIMSVLSSHALLEQSFGTNPGARIYIRKCGKPTGLHWAAFCSTGLLMSSTVSVAQNCMNKDLFIEGNKSHTQEKKILNNLRIWRDRKTLISQPRVTLKLILKQTAKESYRGVLER